MAAAAELAAHRPVTFATGPGAVGTIVHAVADGTGTSNATPARPPSWVSVRTPARGKGWWGTAHRDTQVLGRARGGLGRRRGDQTRVHDSVAAIPRGSGCLLRMLGWRLALRLGRRIRTHTEHTPGRSVSWLSVQKRCAAEVPALGVVFE